MQSEQEQRIPQRELFIKALAALDKMMRELSKSFEDCRDSQLTVKASYASQLSESLRQQLLKSRPLVEMRETSDKLLAVLRQMKLTGSAIPVNDYTKASVDLGEHVAHILSCALELQPRSEEAAD